MVRGIAKRVEVVILLDYVFKMAQIQLIVAKYFGKTGDSCEKMAKVLTGAQKLSKMTM